MDDRERLLKRLRHAGYSDEELEAASEEGRLVTLAVETALGGGLSHTLTAVARESGLDTKFVRALMQAMGRPAPPPRQPGYSDDDVEIARFVRGFLDAGLPREGVLAAAPVLTLGMVRTAEAFRMLVGNALLRPGDSEFTVGLRYAEAVDQLSPLVPPLLTSEFRVHLRDGIRGHLITEAEREAGELDGTRPVGVAFADLVGYTNLGEHLDPQDVGRIATRLVEISARAATKPVSLVKTIGDGAMFVSTEVPPLIDTMSAVITAVQAEGPDYPSVRVGVAFGPATSRDGDWFGGIVNLASRVTDAGRPARILATEEVREQAPDLAWKRKRRLRSLKGISDRVRLFSLDPVSAGASGERPGG